MVISILKEATDEIVQAYERLIPQLSSTARPPTREEIQDMASSSSVTFIAREGDLDGKIIGSLTLAIFRVPTGIRSIIEDVVVDEAARGQGAGEALTRAALDEARRIGCKTVDLTSRPSREAANRLYQRVGFVLRTSNLYRYDLTKQ